MTTKTKRKAVTPPTSAKVEAKAPLTEKKFVPQFTNKQQQYKASVYQLNSKATDRNGLPQYPIISLLRAEDIIFDPVSGENKKIRYIPGEPSILVEEQPSDAKMKDPLVFNNGFLFVEHTNPTLKKYLDSCNGNGSNPHRIKSKNVIFTKKDEEKSAQDKIAQVSDTMDAVQAALKMPLNELIGYAKVLGVNTSKSVDEIRWDMKVQAEKNPKVFLGRDERPTNRNEAVVAYGSRVRYYFYERSQGITWVPLQETLICVPAIGVKPIDRMVDFCSEGEGEQIYAEIERRLQALNG